MKESHKEDSPFEKFLRKKREKRFIRFSESLDIVRDSLEGGIGTDIVRESLELTLGNEDDQPKF